MASSCQGRVVIAPACASRQTPPTTSGRWTSRAIRGWATGRGFTPSVVDDHSRYAPCLTALEGETGEAVKTALTRVFEVHGLPLRMFTDNGNP